MSDPIRAVFSHYGKTVLRKDLPVENDLIVYAVANLASLVADPLERPAFIGELCEGDRILEQRIRAVLRDYPESRGGEIAVLNQDHRMKPGSMSF